MRKISPGALLAGVMLLLICLAGLFAGKLWIERNLDAKVDALRAAGQPASLIDLEHPAMPDEENAATFLRRAHVDVQALATEIEANYARDPEYKLAHDQDVALLFPATLQESMAKSFAAHPGVIPLLERAAACGEYAPTRDHHVSAEAYVGLLLEDIAPMRNAARALRGWALLEASRDRPDEGLRVCGTLFRLSTRFDRDPFLVSRLLSLAIRGVALQTSNAILQLKATSPAARDALRKDAELEDLTLRLRVVIAGERAWGVNLLREQAPAIRSLLLARDVNSYLEVMGAYWDDASKAPDCRAMLARGNSLAMTATRPARAILPAVQVWEDAEVRTLAETRCLMVLLAALDAPHLADKPAPTIDDLAFPHPLTVDPYTGGKLTLRKVPDGWLIYSTGHDLKDDGGKVAEYTDVGFAPPALRPESPEETESP